RRDATLLGDQMRRALEDFLAAECAARPVILVLEDLHVGDLPSVKFVDAVLRHLRELPLLVLAVARPEVLDLFPKLWEERGRQDLRLGALAPKAAARLARAALPDAPPEWIDRAVTLAGGNPFYLEEVLRAL